jgi:hypothetical protein
MNVGQLVEWELSLKTEVLRENPTQCHFIHHRWFVYCSALSQNMLANYIYRKGIYKSEYGCNLHNIISFPGGQSVFAVGSQVSQGGGGQPRNLPTDIC